MLNSNPGSPISGSFSLFFRIVLGLWIGFSLCLPARAEPLPEVYIEKGINGLIDQFNQRRDELAEDHAALYVMVDEITRPFFDFDRISKLILAQNWKKASEEQRREFGEEFRRLMIRTYATALFRYHGGGSISFTSTKIRERSGFKFAKVESEVVLEGGPMQVDYSMILGEDNQWKIYNMVIEGINLVTNYRKTYDASIRKQGLDGLIRSMREANDRKQ